MMVSETSDIRSLRIALVHTADIGGGAEASTISLQKALGELGHRCQLYVGRKEGDGDSTIEIKRYRPLPGLLRLAQVLERRLGWQYLYHPWFRRLDSLFDEPVDVIHFQSLWSGQLGYADVGGLPLLSKRYPSILTLRDLWMLTGHCAYPASGCERWRNGCGQCPDLSLAPSIPVDGTRFNWKRKQRCIARSHLTVTAVSDWMARTASESPIFTGKDIRTVHNGVDETIFKPQDRLAVRRQLGIPVDKFVVLVAGQSVEGTSATGTGAVEHAIASLRVSESDPFVLAVGRSATSFLERWSGEGVAVPFLTDRAALASHYAAADVVLVASLWETFGRIPAEAQMCGTPVVAFATGGIPEIVVDGVTGLLASTGDSSHLGAQLRRISNDLGMRNRFGAAAAETASAKFSNTAVAQEYVRLYREVIESRKSGG